METQVGILVLVLPLVSRFSRYNEEGGKQLAEVYLPSPLLRVYKRELYGCEQT